MRYDQKVVFRIDKGEERLASLKKIGGEIAELLGLKVLKVTSLKHKKKYDPEYFYLYD